MASEDHEDFQMNSVVRGHHVYKDIWLPYVGEVLAMQQEINNPQDNHAVGILKNDVIVGHVPIEVSRVFWFFISHGGTITCRITGHWKFGKGLEVPCEYICIGPPKIIKKMVKLIAKHQ